MRDDVVQLAGDPHALARHRVALALGALALELLGARPQLGGQVRAAAAEAPQRPAAREEHDGEDDVADRLVGAERRDDDDQRAHADESGLRAAAGQVRADREGQDGDEDRGGGEVLGRRVRERERDGHGADRAPASPSGAVLRQAIAAVRTAPSSRAGTSGVSRTEVSISSTSMTTPSAAAQGEVDAPRPRDAHAAGSPTGRRARSSKPRGRRRPARSSPP